MRWMLLSALVACSSPTPVPVDVCEKLVERLDALEAESQRCRKHTDCELVLVRPVIRADGPMGGPPGECGGAGVAAGRGDAWTRTFEDLEAAGCLTSPRGRCRLEQWEAHCGEGECGAHTTSGY